MATLATETPTPGDCIRSMIAASLDIAAMGVHVEWADLVDDAGHWNPEENTLQIDNTCSLTDATRVLREFVDLCAGRGDGSWEHVRPTLRLVVSAGR
jgi:hypothetical protein